MPTERIGYDYVNALNPPNDDVRVRRVVELAPRDKLFREPLHPYTEALISAIPLPDPVAQRKRTRIILKGELPKPTAPPPGSPFHTRCPIAIAQCREIVPPMEEKRSGHWAACHLRG